MGNYRRQFLAAKLGIIFLFCNLRGFHSLMEGNNKTACQVFGGQFSLDAILRWAEISRAENSFLLVHRY